MWKPEAKLLPEMLQAVDQGIRGQMTGIGQEDEVRLAIIRQIESKQMHLVLGLHEIMVQRRDLHPGPASPREPSQLDRGFGIHRDSQDLLVQRCILMHAIQLLEDVVGFREFFLGWLLRTARKW